MQEGAYAGNGGHLRPQILNHVINMFFALMMRFQADKNSAIARFADARHECIDIRIIHQDLSHSLLVLHHGVIGRPLCRFGLTEHHRAVFTGQKSLGRGLEQHDRQHESQKENSHRQGFVAKGERQRPAIQVQHRIENLLGLPVQPAMMLLFRRLQESAAKHGRQS